MRDGKPRRRTPRTQVQTEDGVQPPKRGEIAHLLHMDMAAHRKKTAEFNDGWKRALRVASIGLAIVSLLKAVEKAREGDSGWQERGLTAANAGLICAWVAKIDENAENGSLLPCHTAAFALSLYQMVAWWTSRQGGTHVDFPVAVILFIVVLASVASMKSTLHAVDNAFRASGALADKVDIRHR
ncbi:unnamed protein product [Hapterophycus canaliculatus]